MNREGKTYRCEKSGLSTFADERNGSIVLVSTFADERNGSIVLVLRSEAWNPERLATSNYTHTALVLECPSAPQMVGKEVKIDERYYTRSLDGVIVSTFLFDDKYVEI